MIAYFLVMNSKRCTNISSVKEEKSILFNTFEKNCCKQRRFTSCTVIPENRERHSRQSEVTLQIKKNY